jgi:hypothetical protein
MKVSGHLPAPGVLSQGKKPPLPDRIGGWMDSKAGQDFVYLFVKNKCEE